jgi:hypothetical protein
MRKVDGWPGLSQKPDLAAVALLENEAGFELTYQAQVVPGFLVQPPIYLSSGRWRAQFRSIPPRAAFPTPLSLACAQRSNFRV